MAYSLRESRQFVRDLENLDPIMRKRANKSLRQLENDPYYPGLDSHGHGSIKGRNAMRSRVNDNFRILWEWGESGVINLWRVAKHDVIDAMLTLPTAAGANWTMYSRDADGAPQLLHDWREDIGQPKPFRNVPDNHFRLFGVPDEQLAAVKSLADEEAIWDMPLPENVQYTLYDVLMKAHDWTADALLDTSQLLYRATADQLEGYCEGKIKRLLLNLNEEQQSYVTINANGPVLMKGVAGSGKTTIGLYRAHHLAQLIQEQGRIFGDKASILLLTYTKTLTKALEQLYLEKFGNMPLTLTVQGHKEWMLKLLHDRGIWLNAADDDQRKEIIRHAKDEVAKQYPQDTFVVRRSDAYLLAEIDQVIRARGLDSLAEYQAVERVGRGVGLSREQHRPILWEIYQRYQQLLDERKLFDWADLARLAMKNCQPLPQYDVVIVDEAQDLPPSDLQLLAQVIPDYSQNRSLTLLADPAQSIYYRGIPWKEAGISIQGRTRILAKNFRNTHQILDAARSIVEGCEDLKAADEYTPPTSASRPGTKPVVVQWSSYDARDGYIKDTIIDLCRHDRYRLGDIAILARNKTFLTRFVQPFFRKHNIPSRLFRDDHFHILENEVKLITMHSAKGLEFPVVFIVGLDDRYMPRIDSSSLTKTEDELQERKLFYVSMTRASERLYLLHPRNNRSRFIYNLDKAAVRSVKL